VTAARFDLDQVTLREVNDFLHHGLTSGAVTKVEIVNPRGMHNIAAGVDWPGEIDIRGHAGYFIGGMNKQASIIVHGNVGWSVGENIMSGLIRVKGNASECAGASGHGGLIVIEGDCSSRCGISLKGADIVVGGSVGHVSGFMAQAGRMVICGDAAAGLGDSIYEAVIYVRGQISSLGADAREEPMSEADCAAIGTLLSRAEINLPAGEFKRIASARSLYHWNVDANQEY
jgi:methylamine---glutamate N-methyltransferase subunit B